MTISDLLRKHGKYRPHKPAIIERSRSISYRMLDRMVDHACHTLAGHGVGFGMLIGVMLPDDAEHLVIMLALGRLGAVMLPLDPRWPIVEAQGVAQKFAADRVLFELGDGTDGWLRVQAHWFGDSDRPFHEDRVSEATPMLLSLSSGTTGPPKGPLVSHGQFCARFLVYWIDLGLGAQDRFVTATPLYFGGGRAFTLAMLYAGGTCCLLPPPWKPPELLDFIDGVRGTAMFLVPTQLRRLLEVGAGSSLKTLRVLISSGAALHAAEQRAVRESLCPNLYQYYSSTEGGGCTVLLPAEFEESPDSVGRPLFGVDVEVVDDAHQPVATGTVGRIRYRSSASATEYYLGESSTAFHEGWFYPGDLGAFDEQGHLYLRGRSKEMIIRGGVNIYPVDIERVLTGFDEVSEAAIVGRPSVELGEDIVAFVVTRRPIPAETLRARCRERLASYKVPTAIVFVDSLPKSSLGKVLKSELLKQLP